MNPNNKVPVIVDGDATVFDSNAILLYLGEKTGKFMPPAGDANRSQLLSWLMFVGTGVGPYLRTVRPLYSPLRAAAASSTRVERYHFEAKRHYGTPERSPCQPKSYMVADTYTIVDMDVWGWARMIPFVLGEDCLGRGSEPEASGR